MADFALGKIQAALASATNELTIAAANINLDFTLMKFEAPTEYQPLLNVLTSNRKKEAEHGSIHVTARRLAALFEGVCPNTPQLLKAYGTRASEISKNASDKQVVSQANLFGDYLGVDAASIWAAATSSNTGGAIQIHLLACLIARVWSPSEAVSLWDEIINERRNRVASLFESNSQVPYSTLTAVTQQNISRESLANWDASARAWLRTADSVKAQEQTQFSLVLKNVSLPVNGEIRPYDSVMTAWTSALQTLEKLIGGEPHDIRDGTVLLAMSSWHLYPDMVVHGTEGTAQCSTEVAMEDPLIATGGVVSLGLSGDAPGSTEKSVFWSMPLGRFKFYGNPVRKTRTLQDDGSRLSFNELLQANLGVVLGAWGVSPNDWEEHLKLMIKLLTIVRADQTQSLEEANWVNMLLQPAMAFFDDPKRGEALVSLGSRRPNFLRREHYAYATPPVLFGACRSVAGLQELLRDRQANIAVLRRLCASLGHGRFRPIIAGTIQDTTQHGTVFNSKPWRGYPTMGPIRYWVASANFGAIRPDKEPTQHEFTLGVIPEFNTSRPPRLPDIFTHVNGTTYYAATGDPSIAAVYVEREFMNELNPYSEIALSDISWCVEHEFFSPTGFYELIRRDNTLYAHLRLLSLISDIYATSTMRQARISCRVLERPLVQPWPKRRPFLPWTRNSKLEEDADPFLADARLPFEEPSVEAQASSVNRDIRREKRNELDRANQALAVLAYFETGSVGIQNLPDESLDRIIGMSFGDSIYVKSELISDPWRSGASRGKPYEYTRLLGNIGKPGLSLLTCPSDLMIGKSEPGSWKTANYSRFDREVYDSFGNTSMHLQLLDWSQPLSSTDSVGQLTPEASLVEAVVSIRDRGLWVGDVDISAALSHPSVFFGNPPHNHDHADDRGDDVYMTALDSWDEVLDSPKRGLAVVRCHQNWIARLALTGILADRWKKLVVCPDRTTKICWPCFVKDTADSSMMTFYIL